VANPEYRRPHRNGYRVRNVVTLSHAESWGLGRPPKGHCVGGWGLFLKSEFLIRELNFWLKTFHGIFTKVLMQHADKIVKENKGGP
jgi:hypothetical protein